METSPSASLFDVMSSNFDPLDSLPAVPDTLESINVISCCICKTPINDAYGIINVACEQNYKYCVACINSWFAETNLAFHSEDVPVQVEEYYICQNGQLLETVKVAPKSASLVTDVGLTELSPLVEPDVELARTRAELRSERNRREHAEIINAVMIGGFLVLSIVIIVGVIIFH